MGSRLDSHTFTVSYGGELKVMTTVNLFLCCSVFGKNFQANIMLLYSRQNIFILMVKEVFCFRKQMQWSIFTSGKRRTCSYQIWQVFHSEARTVSVANRHGKGERESAAKQIFEKWQPTGEWNQEAGTVNASQRHREDSCCGRRNNSSP